MLKSLLRFLLARFRQALNARRASRMLATGIAQIERGDREAARRVLDQALAIDPRNATANFHLGTLAALVDAYPECARHFARAIELEPGHAGWWLALGDLAERHADHAKAAEYFAASLAIAPDPAVQRSLARMLRKTGRRAEAIMHLRRAHALSPEAPGVMRELVTALIEYDMCDKALSIAAAAAERDPASYEALYCLGLAHHKLHDPQRALSSYQLAMRIRPDDAELHDARGSACQELGNLDEALGAYERALALRPDYAPARFHRALAWLLLQDFERGWPGYELRRSAADGASIAAAAPQWGGESLSGRTILLRMEQGLGDEIMFASMLPEMFAMAGHCIIECDPRLRALFGRSFPGATVFGALPDRSLPLRIARHDIAYEAHLGSLPLLLRRSAAAFPRGEGYLGADPLRVEHWRKRLAQLGPGPKIGISWTGGVRKTRRALRSIALPEWLPVLSTPGTRFVSLQYTPEAAAEAAALEERHGVRIEHWPEAIEDYDETAALVCALDLVISVCTSVVHLCGALGRPAWVMVPHSPEWRYGFSGDSMPWYASVKLYRAPAFGQMRAAIGSVSEALRQR